MPSIDLPLTQPSLVLLLLFSLVLVMPRLAERFRLPGLVGLIAGGLLVGPNGLGLVERDGAVALIGGAGLLYLMFQAGLEMDLDEFAAQRRGALIFGVTSFVIPMALSVVVLQQFGFSASAAVLMGCCWASHTLLTYPVFRRARVARNRAVAVAVGGTIVTDSGALLVLVIVARAHQGDLGPGYLVLLFGAVLGAAAVILVGVPRLTSWFFTSIGQERSARFLFVLVILFGAASLAEIAGVEAIIGAFLAGLAMNRLIPEGGTLSTQIEFLGQTLLIPFFLISVGMLVDLEVAFNDPGSIGEAGIFLGLVVGGKLLAALVAGRGLGFNLPEIGALFSLSVAQAAATLAVVFVGLQIELIDEQTVNAVILVILATALLSSVVAAQVVTRIPPPPAKVGKLGGTVMVPLGATENADELIRLAALIAAHDSGTVVPITVLDLEASSDDVAELREKLGEDVERLVLANGAEAQSQVRLDLTPTAGMLHSAVETRATCIVMGWKGWTTRRAAFFGEQVDTMLAASLVPVLVVRPGGTERHERVVLAVEANELDPIGRAGVDLAAAVALRLSERAKLPLLVVTTANAGDIDEFVPAGMVTRTHANPDLSIDGLLADVTIPGDVVITGLTTTRAGLGPQVPRLARTLRGRTLVAAAPR